MTEAPKQFKPGEPQPQHAGADERPDARTAAPMDGQTVAPDMKDAGQVETPVPLPEAPTSRGRMNVTIWILAAVVAVVIVAVALF